MFSIGNKLTMLAKPSMLMNPLKNAVSIQGKYHIKASNIS